MFAIPNSKDLIKLKEYLRMVYEMKRFYRDDNNKEEAKVAKKEEVNVQQPKKKVEVNIVKVPIVFLDNKLIFRLEKK